MDLYEAAKSNQDKKQAQWVLALYSPFHQQCDLCMTHALSKADDANARSLCDHEHSPKSELMRQDVALLHALREEINLYSNEVDRKDHLWSLDRAQGLLNE